MISNFEKMGERHTSLPSCTVIIPTKDQLPLLKRCVEGVLSSDFGAYLELIIVNNQSTEKKTLSYLDSLLADSRVRVLSWDAPFNFSSINNMAANYAKGEILCFLNNDIEILSGTWLEILVNFAKHPDVGAVGALLLYPDKTIQHAGVALDRDWVGLHVGQHEDSSIVSKKYYLNALYPIHAVTAACMLTSAARFRELGGFNENELKVSFNDVDYCLRLREMGLPTFIYPGVQLVHHESATRKSDDIPENRKRAEKEKEYMLNKWGWILRQHKHDGSIPFKPVADESSALTPPVNSASLIQSAREELMSKRDSRRSVGSFSSSNQLENTWEDRYRLLQVEYRALEFHFQTVQNELLLILNSRSWRALGPTRNLIHYLKTMKQAGGRQLVSTQLGRKLYDFVTRKGRVVKVDSIEPTIDYKRQHLETSLSKFEKFLHGDGILSLPDSENPTVSIILILYNQAPLSFLCLQSIIEHADVPVEVVIIDNASSDQTSVLLERCQGAAIIRNSENIGFVHAVNQGAEKCRGKHILLLNNDASLLPLTLSIAVNTLESEPNAGAVGGKILLLDGSLQEAGSIIWKDGSCLGYGRGKDPELPEFMFRRDVDYCSGAFLMFPRHLFEELGGFDTEYAPAYYEESDFCVRLQKLGYRIIFEPQSAILHYEFASSGGFENASKLQIAHKEIFQRKHTDFLANRYVSSEKNILRARTTSRGKNVLVIDDRVPHADLGAGYPRSRHILQELSELGFNVTFFPLRTSYDEWGATYLTLPRNVEVMLYLGKDELQNFLASRAGTFDFMLISRSHNMSFFNSIIAKNPELIGQNCTLIYDAEAVTAARDVLQLRLSGKEISKQLEQEMIAKEISLADTAQKIICVSNQEADLYRNFGRYNLHVLGHASKPSPTRNSYKQRTGFLFVGALRDDGSPNVDSLLWFAENVLPLLEERCTFPFELIVIGDRAAPSLRFFHHPRIRFLGRQSDISSFYNHCRVFIAPTRFAAGIPHKVHESASHGVPVVATSLLSRQLGWTHESELLVADSAESFADQCARLYNDKDLWEATRQKALKAVSLDCSPDRFRTNLQTLFTTNDQDSALKSEN